MSLRTRVSEAAVVAVALAVAIALAELVVRVVAPQTLPSQGEIRSFVLRDMYLSDDRLGFRLAPGFEGRIEFAGNATVFATNSLGMRGAEVGPKTRPRIAAFGDSFTFGWGVAQGEEWIHVVGKEIERLGGPAVETLNCGVNGYGTANAAEWLAEIGPKLSPDVVLLGFFANDYTDNLLASWMGSTAIHSVRDGYLFDQFSHEYFKESFLARESHLYRMLSAAWETFRVRYLHRLPSSRPVKNFTEDEFRRGMELSEQHIVAMARTAATLGARFAVVWLPADVYVFARSRPEDIDVQWELQRRLAAADIPSVDLLPVAVAEQRPRGLYIPMDGHFTVRGNRVAGRAIAKWLLASGLLANEAASTP